MAVGEGRGVVEEMEREAGIAPPTRVIPEEPRQPRITSGGVLRLLVFVALAAFLLYYVGPRGAVVDRQRRRLEEEIAKCQEALAALPIITEDRDKVVSNLVYSPAYNDLTAVEDKPEEEETAP